MEKHEEHLLVFSQIKFMSWVAKMVGFHTSGEDVRNAPTTDDGRFWTVLISMGFLVLFISGVLAHVIFSFPKASPQTATAPIAHAQLAQAK